jgi:hypothetical protein
MTCQLCRQDIPLIDAHIIPRPFFRPEGPSGAPKFLSNTDGSYPKRAPIGIYDPGILCAKCDGRIGRWDEYGVELFIQSLDAFTPVIEHGDLVAFQRDTFDYSRLRLFVLSVLWRAHLSSHEMFRRVDLGERADRLREMVESDGPGDSREFSMALSAFTVRGKIPNIGIPIADPFMETWDGVNACRLSFGVVTAYVSVDRAPLPQSLMAMGVVEDRPLILIERDYSTSSEIEVARSIARSPQNARAFRKP